MSLRDVGEEERRVILQCLDAVCHGPLLDDVEFHTRVGLDRREVESLLAEWPDLDDSKDDCNATLAINNVLNELSHGLTAPDEQWKQWIGCSREEIVRVYRAWARARGWNRTGVM